ncbi:hypothetical protein HDE_07548 [Halotydeus destructor]|nr:hypothetical protein HDE_07548 [Halotydeus destructor]
MVDLLGRAVVSAINSRIQEGDEPRDSATTSGPNRVPEPAYPQHQAAHPAGQRNQPPVGWQLGPDRSPVHYQPRGQHHPGYPVGADGPMPNLPPRIPAVDKRDERKYYDQIYPKLPSSD